MDFGIENWINNCAVCHALFDDSNEDGGLGLHLWRHSLLQLPARKLQAEFGPQVVANTKVWAVSGFFNK